MRNARVFGVVVGLLLAFGVPMASPARAMDPIVDLASWSFFDTSPGEMAVVGEIVNGTSTAKNPVYVQFNQYDRLGTKLSSDVIYTSLATIGPGERSGFRGSVQRALALYKFEFVIYAGEAVHPADHNFTVTVTKTYRDTDGNDHVVGTVRNNNTVAVTPPVVHTTFYTQDRTAINEVDDYVIPADQRTMAPGEVGTFDVLRYDGSEYTSYAVVAESPDPPTPMPTSLRIACSGLDYGQPLQVAGYVLERAVSTPAAGAHLQLFSRRTSRAPWKFVGSGRTDSGGEVDFGPKGKKATRNITFQFRMQPGGGFATAQSASCLQVINAAVTRALSPRSVSVGSAARLTTTVVPAEAGRTVTLQRLDGKRWVDVAHHRLNSDSATTFRIVEKSKGNRSYRTSVGPTTTNGAGQSDRITLTAR
jgi:5-hydroxyisourate hydrolase-like protein (transthyretin family)